MKPLFFLFFSLLLCSQLNAQWTQDPFPLDLGNRWVYKDDQENIHTRNITDVQMVEGIKYFIRVDSSFVGNEVSRIDTVVFFYRPEDSNDIMSISKNQLVDTMKVRQVVYDSNPHMAVDPEWAEVYATPDGPYDSIMVTAYRGFLGISDVAQMGEIGIFEHPISYTGIFQDSISEEINIFLTASDTLLGNAQMTYGPGDIFIYEKNAELIAFQVQTTTGVKSWSMPEELKLYPNPAHDILFLDRQETIAQVEVVGVMNLLGSRMNVRIEKTSSSSPQSIDISQLPMGTYLLLLEVDGYLGTMRFIKN